MKKRWKKEENLDFWQPASDMFSALMLIFMLLILLLGLYLVYIPEYRERDPWAGDTYLGGDNEDEGDVSPLPSVFAISEGDSDDWGGGGGEDETPIPVEQTPSPSPSITPSPTPTPDDPGSGGGTGGGNGGGDGPGDTPDEGLKVAVYVMMVDAETDRTVKEGEVQFELYEEDGALQILNTYYPERVSFRMYDTTEAGTFYFPEKLPTGQYYLHELTEPAGYDAAENQHFVLDRVYDWPDPYVVRVPMYPSRNVVRVQMTDAEDGRPVPGGSFNLIAAENIITADGTLRYRAGQIVDTIECDGEGYGVSEPVYFGSYLLRQLEIPAYYAGLQEDIDVTVEKKSNVLPALYTVESLRTRINVALFDELYTTQPVAGAAFRVTADRGGAEPLELRTGSDGRIVLEELEKGATYRIRQTEASGNYRPELRDYTVTVDLQGYIGGETETELVLTNRLIRVTVGLTDEMSSVQVPNVNLALFDHSDTMLRTWTTSGNPLMFTNLEPGSYYVVKDGDTEKKFDFRVADTAEIQEFTIYTTYMLHYIIIGASATASLAVIVLAMKLIAKHRKKKNNMQGR